MINGNRKTRYFSGVAFLLSSGLMLGASEARADTDAAVATAPAADQIETVTVYARKRAENVQQVPVPITVLTTQELARQNMVSFDDFQYKFPSFSVLSDKPQATQSRHPRHRQQRL